MCTEEIIGLNRPSKTGSGPEVFIPYSSVEILFTSQRGDVDLDSGCFFEDLFDGFRCTPLEVRLQIPSKKVYLYNNL